MRTKWQSSPESGNGSETGLMGNLRCGDAAEPVWEIQLDLRRSVYFFCDHPPYT
ncbi:hypothetical protein ALCH109712_04685 [Alkalicoccus chagannorensis]